MSDADKPSIGVENINKQHFQTTAWLVFSWRLLADGISLPIGSADHDPSTDGWVPLEADGDITMQPQVPLAAAGAASATAHQRHLLHACAAGPLACGKASLPHSQLMIAGVS